MAHAHAQGRIERVIEGDFVEPARRGLFLTETRGIEPGGDFRLDRRVCCPAIGAAVPVGANEDIYQSVTLEICS